MKFERDKRAEKHHLSFGKEKVYEGEGEYTTPVRRGGGGPGEGGVTHEMLQEQKPISDARSGTAT
jgi:hypothetical protein